MSHHDIRKKFLDFFAERGHKVVPSSSLLPDDPSVLLTTAGMQQFKRYFTGELDPMKDFGSKNTASIQKAFRTSDIDEVGDETHLTFFEMLGHFSFGGYFKKETIEWTYELLNTVFQIPSERISATVFQGDEIIPFDQESFDAWSKLLPPDRIRKGPRADNVWGPAGTEGPCGACNEVYVDGVEVATLVFMEYYSHADRSLTKLSKKGVDVGWGLERIVAKLQNKENIFETDLFSFVFLNAEFSEKFDIRPKRIIADHTRAIAFMITDGIRPSNKDQGYILRRLIRRVVTLEYLLGTINFGSLWAGLICDYVEFYPTLDAQVIEAAFEAEKEKFLKTLKSGLKELEKLSIVDADMAFKLYESFGLPYEVVKDVARDKAKDLTRDAFDAKFKEHQEKSRAGVEKKFGGHGLLLDTGELKAANEEELKKVTRLHTATHLLHQALRKTLGDTVRQAGSDITVERTRFDFTFDRKLTADEIKNIEEVVNNVINKDLPVQKVTMPKIEAEKTGALFFFKEKYPDPVNVYYVGESVETAWSKEFCGGPHVTHTGEIRKFKIIKEEAVAAGTRRIRATVE